ncbi:MAG: DUF421 domain-containing protein [Dermabacteraceae bacterium]|uniref:DUF421 domain-containing protein n=1 Tax=Brachybacterium sp. TaxID=1891286 RepID=UPI00264BEFA0|nr:DUF421 domain-containing protein [Brachybacterium sp.]MDN6329743.1 DUF421 domain-containing protein [Brachybacterium sp.]MDN6401060.1 DUF421 domain-containing protein [Brachybacterium sp.]
MTFFEELWFQIGASPAGALGVLIASVVLYLVFTLVLELSGQRLSANPSVSSFAVMALLGALMARAILGNTPTLVGGLIAVGTLLMLEYSLGHLRQGIGRVFSRRHSRSTVVMVHGHALHWQLRHLSIDDRQLLTLLRRNGIHRLTDADLVILEPRGGLTVVRRGEQIDEGLVRGVRGIGIVPRSLLR